MASRRTANRRHLRQLVDRPEVDAAPEGVLDSGGPVVVAHGPGDETERVATNSARACPAAPETAHPEPVRADAEAEAPAGFLPHHGVHARAVRGDRLVEQRRREQLRVEQRSVQPGDATRGAVTVDRRYLGRSPRCAVHDVRVATARRVVKRSPVQRVRAVLSTLHTLVLRQPGDLDGAGLVAVWQAELEVQAEWATHLLPQEPAG